MVNFRLEVIKIVVIEKIFYRESVPQTVALGKRISERKLIVTNDIRG